MYYISKCQLKLANKQFATLKNDYEMTFTNDTIVQECNDAAASVPMIQYNFVTIDKIGHMEVGTIIGELFFFLFDKALKVLLMLQK